MLNGLLKLFVILKSRSESIKSLRKIREAKHVSLLPVHLPMHSRPRYALISTKKQMQNYGTSAHLSEEERNLSWCEQLDCWKLLSSMRMLLTHCEAPAFIYWSFMLGHSLCFNVVFTLGALVMINSINFISCQLSSRVCFVVALCAVFEC